MTGNIKKATGATFTPKPLANFLANVLSFYISKQEIVKVEDPACGDGVLLEAIGLKLKELNQDFSIKGYDTSQQFVERAKYNLGSIFPSVNIDIQNENFILNRIAENNLFSNVEYQDVVIANPPYVRTQILGADVSRQISKQYSLKGKIDLYYPFIINITNTLKEGGLLGIITSNRYLTTKSGADIRKFLVEHYDILEVIDLGDTKIFDAAVLPAIFIGRKNSSKKKKTKGIFKKIYETSEVPQFNASSIYDILSNDYHGVFKVDRKCYSYSIGEFIEPKEKGDVWQFISSDENTFIKTILNNCECFIGDLFKVRVGVKSCADDVFFISDWEQETKPEDIFFRPIISQENITQWSITSELRKVIYPHYDDNGVKTVYDISKYPNAKAFFEIHSKRLKSRQYLLRTKGRKWYEYWVPQNASLWKYPKVVFADISIEPRFAIDYSGSIVDGNCYWMNATNESELEYLKLILGVSNSKVIEQYHDLCFNNKLYSGRRRYLTQYVERYPLPKLSSHYSKEIIAIVDELCENHVSNLRLREAKEELNTLVEFAFGLRVE